VNQGVVFELNFESGIQASYRSISRSLSCVRVLKTSAELISLPADLSIPIVLSNIGLFLR
jgi:hypothetical protein